VVAQLAKLMRILEGSLNAKIYHHEHPDPQPSRSSSQPENVWGQSAQAVMEGVQIPAGCADPLAEETFKLWAIRVQATAPKGTVAQLDGALLQAGRFQRRGSFARHLSDEAAKLLGKKVGQGTMTVEEFERRAETALVAAPSPQPAPRPAAASAPLLPAGASLSKPTPAPEPVPAPDISPEAAIVPAPAAPLVPPSGVAPTVVQLGGGLVLQVSGTSATPEEARDFVASFGLGLAVKVHAAGVRHGRENPAPAPTPAVATEAS